MKKGEVILFGVILVIMIISGCATQEVSDIVPEEFPQVEGKLPENKPVAEETPEITEEPEEEIPVEEIVETAPAAEEPHEEKPVQVKEKPALPAPPTSFEDKFDGTSIDHDRYSTTITGAGTIAQNNEIVMAGKGEKTIIWNVLYTKGDVDLTKGFTASVKINMKKAAVTVGDDMVIIGIEKQEDVQAGRGPGKEAGYCEVFIETRHGDETRLRMQNTLGKDNGEGVRVSKTSGVLALTYLPENKLLKCSFDNKEVTLSQPQDTGSFALTLRAGMHEDVIKGREYSEAGGTGEFETVFDDLEFKSAAVG